MKNYYNSNSIFEAFNIDDLKSSLASLNRKSKGIICLFMFMMLAIGQLSWAQSTANYSFTTNATSSLALNLNGNAIDMTTGTTQLVAPLSDGNVSAVTNIGFNYYFMGNFYSQFSASADGILGLGSTAVTGTAVSGGSTTTPRISALGADFYVSASGKVHYKIVGSAPNRCLVVEWTGMAVTYNTTAANGNSQWQVRLYESTGVVEYVYGAINCTSTTYNPVSTGFSVNTTANNTASVTYSSNTVSNGATFNTNTLALGDVPNLNSTTNGSRRAYLFTPPAPASGPTGLSFASVTPSTTTLNWVAASSTTGIVRYVVLNSTNGGATYNFVANVALGTNTYAATALTPGTTYDWKVIAISEGNESTATIGTQATAAATAYYWVGTSSSAIPSDFATLTNWNTAANGSGSTPSAFTNTDVFIVDGDGATTTGGNVYISVAAATTLGQIKVTSNTALSMQATTTTARTITITGSPGDDFVVESGSTLNLTNAANAVAFAFSGTGNTGLIAGTVNFAGSTSNVITTTGGTNTLVTVASTGIVNLGAAGNTLVGSATTLSFAAGSNCNSTGATTGAPPVPLATWDTTSTLTISGITTSTTTATNNAQSFGNFVYNCPAATATMNFFGTNNAIIKGNLTITAAGATGGSGIFRATSSGTITVNGDVIITQGKFQSATSGTVIANGNTTIAANGILDIASGAGTYSQRGNTLTNNGILTSTTGTLQFLNLTGSAAQTLAGSGTVLTNIATLTLQNTAGLTITHTNPIILVRVNLFQGTITNSNKITFGTGLAVACTTQIGAAGLTTPAGNFDALPIFNLGTGAYNLIYAQESLNRTSGFEVPPARLVSSINLTNSNGLVIAGGNIGTGTLTFGTGSGNITTNSTNVLTVTGTTAASIVRTSLTAYVNGPLAITLPASLATGSTYIFPIGKSTLNPFVLVNPTTNAGGSVTVKSEVFDTATGGTPGTLLGALNSNRYWATLITNGSSNFITTLVRLTDTPNTADSIGASATLTGAYNLIGGITSTLTGTSITTIGLENISGLGYYVMASKAAASLTMLSITPSGNQCTNVSRATSVLVTPGGGAITTVVLNYAINGVAQTAINLINTTNNGGLLADTWTGIIPTVTPSNATVTWSITATDANSLSKSITGTSYSDQPTLGVTALVTASAPTVCAGSPSTLNMNISSGYVNVAEGFEGAVFPPTGWTVTNEGTGNAWITSTIPNSGTKAMQYSYNSTNAANTWMYTPQQQLLAGQTYTVSFWYSVAGASFPEKLKVTVGTAATTAAQTNILWTNSALTNTTYAQATATFTAPTSGTYYFAFNCFSAANQFNLYVDDISITGGINLGAATFSWSDGTSVVGTTNPLIVNPTAATTTYTGTATINGCPLTASTVITANPLPTTPTATNSSQCGTQVPTAAVTDTNGYTTPTYNWYAGSTGGLALQSSTSTTYTTAISATTTFYVGVLNPITGCESPRRAVTVTVSSPDAITATTSSASICIGQSVTLSSVNNASTPIQNYTYSWLSTAGSGVTTSQTGASISVTPTLAGTYTYTVSAIDGGCQTTNTVSVTVNPLPVITTATATPSLACVGSTVNLSASILGVASGTASIGNGTLLTGATSQPTAFCNRWPSYRMQTVYTAAELQAAGLTAGNITSMAFNISTLGDGATNSGFIVKIGSTTLSALTTFESTTAFTTVYPSQTYTHTASGLQTIPFSTPYLWDGTSNIIVEMIHNGADITNNSQTYYTVTTNNTVAYTTTSATNSASVSQNRLNVVFGGQVQSNLSSQYTWSWNSTPAINAASGTTILPSAPTTTYTVTATNIATGCSASQSVVVTSNPLPIAPTATGSTQCGNQVPTASVADVNAYTNPTFIWHSLASGGTVLQSSTSTTFTTSISATTTFYVSVVNPATGCESTRTPVTVTVNPNPIVITVAPAAVCSPGTVNITASAVTAGSDTGLVYTYFTDSAATIALTTPSAITTSGTYYIKGTNTNGCSTVTAVVVTINVTPAPTGAIVQSFCGSANMTNLTVVGSNVKWYDAATAGNQIPVLPIVGLTNGATYYASQTVNGCEGTIRLAVNVTITPIPAAPTANAQTFCGSGTVSDLVATGTGLQWFALSSGGSALATTTALASGNYYVSQTISGCESPRTLVAVTINNTSAQPTATSPQTFTAPATIANIVVTGTTGTVTWYPTSADAIANTNALSSTTTLVNNTTYYATQTIAGCPSSPIAVVVTVTLRNNSFDMSSLNYYPNPVIDVVTISYSEAISSIEVYNLVGQMVKTLQPNSTTTQLDMSNLPTATYLVKVTSEGKTANIKIVKK